MNKRKLTLVICAIMALLLCSVFAVMAYAEPEAGTGDADYTIVIDGDDSYPMVKDGSTYEYELKKLEEKTLYKIEIKDKEKLVCARALFYKKNEGNATVEFNGTEISMKDESGDRFDSEFDFSTNIYRVTVEKGTIEVTSGEFSGCELSSFYFPPNEFVTVKATLDDDEGVIAWDHNTKESSYGTSEKIIVKTVGSEYDIQLRAIVDYLPIDQLLDTSTEITLKKDYEITEIIKLTQKKEYTIDLGGFDITVAEKNSSDPNYKIPKGVFEVNGATLTIKGSGSIESIADTENGAIHLVSGALTIDGPTVLGKKNAVVVSGGKLTIDEGEFSANPESTVTNELRGASALYFKAGTSAEAVINGGNFNKEFYNTAKHPHMAMSVLGGKITINGGAFYGKSVIDTWGQNRDILIVTGLFVTDSFDGLKSYVDEKSQYDGDAEDGFTVTIKPKKYTISITDGVLSNGSNIGEFEEGETVKLKPIANTDGMAFEYWEILGGGVIIEDTNAKEISFLMPANDVVIRAKFKPTESVVIGTIDSDKPSYPTDQESTPSAGTSEPEPLDPQNTEQIVGAVTAKPDNDKSGGSMALIILIIILIALLIAAIAVSIILIVRNYKIEKAAAERAQLGASVVDDLAEQLSELDFGDMASGAGAVAATTDNEEQSPVARAPKAAPAARGEGIDFDKEINLNNTAVSDAVGAAGAAKADEEIKFRRPKRPTQRPAQRPNDTQGE